MQRIIDSLKKCKINTSSPDVASVLNILARHERCLEVGSVNTELALSTYENVRDASHTQTKSCIGMEINMRINGSVFEDFPFILGAVDSANNPRLVKILRVPDGCLSLSTRQQDMRYEMESVKFIHPAIMPVECKTIVVDRELARKANCREGENSVLIMPWYICTLNKLPSNNLEWIAHEGRRILEALQYLHSYPGGGYVHLDVKAMNVFVDSKLHCFLGDFGSCKPIGESITSCTTFFCWERNLGKPAHPKYDYFMFLLMVLIECLQDRKTHSTAFYEPGAQHASMSKVLAAALSMSTLDTTPPSLVDLLMEVYNKLLEFQLTLDDM